MSKVLITAGAALFLAISAPQLAVAQGCISGGQGQQLVAEGQVMPFPEAVRRAGISPDQLAGNPQLCRGGGGYVYRVQVLQNGNVNSVSIPAN